MSESPHLAQGFQNIDRTTHSDSAIRWLDMVNADQYVQAMRRLNYALMRASEGHHILDVGCGTGQGTLALAQLVGNTGTVIGVDISEAMVAAAHLRADGSGLPVAYIVNDVHQLAFPDNTFDGCRAERVFIYLEDPVKALREMIRVAKPGATLVITEPEMDTLILDGPDRDVVRKLLHFWCDEFRNPWIARQLPNLFRDAGLVDVAVVPTAGSFPFASLEQFGLQALVSRAIAAGIVTAAEAGAWLEFLEASNAAGRFFTAGMGLVVKGVKP